MSAKELKDLVDYHRKQMELNRGKAERATERASFHERTLVALLSKGVAA